MTGNPVGREANFASLPIILVMSEIVLLAHAFPGGLAGPVDGRQKKCLTLFGPDPGNVDLEEANGVAHETLPCRLAAFDGRKAMTTFFKPGPGAKWRYAV